MHSFSVIPTTRPQKQLQRLVGPWAFALLAIAVTPRFAYAQTEESTAIPVQQYEPGPGAEDIMGLQSSHIQKHMEWQLGLHLNIADDPLEFRTLDDDMTIERIIESQTGLDLMAAIGIKDRFEVGLVLPITPYRTHGGTGRLGLPMDLSSAALGDLRLVPKVLLYGKDKGTSLSLSVPISLPTGKDTQFYGEGGLGIEPRLLADYTFAGGTRIGFNLGIRFHPTEKTFANLEIGHELTYGLGARVPFKLAGKNLAAVATLIGSLVLANGNAEERPLELLGGLEFRPNESWTVRVGAGPGLSSGYGTPDFRVLAGVAYRHKPAEKAPCPYGPEDEDGYQDDDQCADPDNDSDGIEDEIDLCPNEPETINQIDDEDGCPEDPMDREEEAGEPLPELEAPQDPDGDGIFGEDDVCPNEPEDKDGYTDLDGCPDVDNDQDSILDVDDKCPLEAEIINGTDDEDGCPDEGKALVDVTKKEIKILVPVYFDTAKATIQERSFPLLDQVSSILKANPQLTKVRVEGHTDNKGRDAYNMKLSDDRANSVKQYLIDKGIDGGRLDAQGYGKTRPIDSNKTKAGRANNRRVQFVIIEVDGQPVPEDAAGNTVETEK